MIDAYRVTKDFEKCVSSYCGAKYGVAVDNCTNALFLSLIRYGVKGKTITIPKRTYVSVPCAIIHAGGRVSFDETDDSEFLTGMYQLKGTNVWDSALSFRRNMYKAGTFMCLSFSGPKKHLKLGKGGMILTDDGEAYEWFKMARYSGRHEVDHVSDTYSMVGWNMYMLPEIAARGLVSMLGVNDYNEDLSLKYQDLSKYSIYSGGSHE